MKWMLRCVFIAGAGSICVSSLASADTLEMKDGREMKGIVVEDYHDRLVLSTPDGEKQLMKADILQLSYDTEEENLMQLAEFARERGDYSVAFAYYDKAFKMNPNSKRAREGVTYVQSLLFKKEEALKEEDVRRRAEFERYQSFGPETTTEEQKQKEEGDSLRRSIGITLQQSGNSFEVAAVAPGSPAEDAGLKKGDHLVAMWGRLTGYMNRDQLVRQFLKQPSLEVKTTIERSVAVDVKARKGLMSGVKELIKATLSMEFDGLTVTAVTEEGPAASGGLRKNDLVVMINKKPTRYMPLKTAMDLIRQSRGDSVEFKIWRRTTIWRKIA